MPRLVCCCEHFHGGPAQRGAGHVAGAALVTEISLYHCKCNNGFFINESSKCTTKRSKCFDTSNWGCAKQENHNNGFVLLLLYVCSDNGTVLFWEILNFRFARNAHITKQQLVLDSALGVTACWGKWVQQHETYSNMLSNTQGAL